MNHMNPIQKEKADIGLLSSLSVDIIAASALLAALEKRIGWMLPFRAIIMKIACLLVANSIQKQWEEAERLVYNRTDTSVHTLSLMYSVKNQNKKIQAFIKKTSDALTAEAIVMPCLFSLLLFAIKVLIG